MKIFISLLIILFSAFSLKAEIINKIIVENNNRISETNIINFADVSLGDDINENKLNQVLKNLYKTNFFSDVKISINNNILNIFVQENKIIQNIQILGIKKESTKKEILDQLILKSRSPYNEYSIKSDLNNIRNALLVEGFYFSEVKSSIKENNNNTIDLIYEITMGDKAIIKNIKFIGNKIYKSNKLRNIIVSEEGKFWKFITSKKFLNKKRIEMDKRLLTNFYLNNGYFNVKINSVNAQLDDKKNFDLVFNIDAGSIYKIKNAGIELPEDFNEKNFTNVYEELEKIKGTIYSQNKVSKIAKLLDNATLLREYEFITATIDEKIVSENNVSVTFTIKESQKKYIEKINIIGNNITEERVIRNSLEIDEGDPFNKILNAKSINNLKSLNIFKNVNITETKAEDENKTILNVEVEEKPTGEISLGAGFGTDGGTIGFSIRENNYLGKGIELDSSLRISDDSVKGHIGLFNPNFNYTDRALNTSLESSTTDKLTTSGYKISKTGFEIGTGFEFLENTSYSPMFSSYVEKLEVNSLASSQLTKQEGNSFDNKYHHSISYDTRDQKYQATEGYYSRFLQSIPLLTEDSGLLNGYDFTKYYKFSNEILTNISFYSRMIQSLDNSDIRLSNRVGIPQRRLKGFESRKIGPKDGNSFIGGNYSAAVNFNTTLPFLFESIDNADVAYFIDAGNVWGVDYSDTIDESNKIRSATGIAVNWYTPVGPLTFSLAQPITKADTDVTESFRFNIGTTF